MGPDLVAEYGRQYQVHRYAPAQATTGRAQVPQEAAGSPFTAFLVVQPISGMKVLSIPEGERDQEWVELYSSLPLNVASPNAGTKGDRFNFGGGMYEVRVLGNRSASDIPHYKYRAAKFTQGR